MQLLPICKVKLCLSKGLTYQTICKGDRTYLIAFLSGAIALIALTFKISVNLLIPTANDQL